MYREAIVTSKKVEMEFLDELSKHLRYRTIDSVIGKRITITSLETLGQDLKEFLKIEIPYLGQIENSAGQFSDGLPSFYLPYMNYRVLDLTLIPDRLIAENDCPSADPSIIEMLGFSDEDVDDLPHRWEYECFIETVGVARNGNHQRLPNQFAIVLGAKALLLVITG